MMHGFDLESFLLPQEPEYILECFSPNDWQEESDGLDRVAKLLERIQNSTDARDALRLALDKWGTPAVQAVLGHPLIDVNGPLRHIDDPALCVAVLRRDERLIRSLLQAGADPKKDPTALHTLARHRLDADKPAGIQSAVACLDLLLQAGADVHLPDQDGRQPLHWAGDASVAQTLLDAGADPDARDADGRTLAHTTTQIAVLEVLAGRANFNLRDQKGGQTPLVYSLDQLAWPDVTKKALWLIQHDADVLPTDSKGNAALHYFVTHSPLCSGMASIDLLRALLPAGSFNASPRNDLGQTPLHMLSRLDRTAQITLHILRYLVHLGADCNAKDDRGQTPLFKVVDSWFGFDKSLDLLWICKQLIDLGADVHATDALGRTLLHAAITEESLDVLEYFLSLGLDPKRSDRAGNTLWHEITMCYSPRTNWGKLFGLLALDISPEKPNKEGKTPLHLVSSRRHRSMESLNAWDRGSHADADYEFPGWERAFVTPNSVNSADLDGVTPLHIASKFSEGLTERFLRAGADPLKTTKDGLGPLQLAARSGKTNILGNLLDSIRAQPEAVNALPAALRQKDALGRTALYYACWSGLPEAVHLLLEAGADADASIFEASPWNGCVALEETELEQELTFCKPAQPAADWFSCVGPQPDMEVRDYSDVAGGVSIHDTVRPQQPGSLYQCYAPTHRIEEIIDMLIEHHPTAARKYIDNALRVATEKRLDYTVECLLTARIALKGMEPHPMDAETDASCHRRAEAQASDQPQGLPHLGHLLSIRAGDAAAAALHEMTGATPDPSDQDLFGDIILSLAHWGHWRVLSRGVSPALLRRPYSGPCFGVPTPLLISACERAEPNMAVVRGLVEQASVDLEDRGGHWATALHVLARGGRWWQAHEALPYLLSRGADADARDNLGRTPLIVALSSPAPPSFTWAAVARLLDHGADADAVDDRGLSCQAHARARPDLVALLRAHGADPRDSASRAVRTH